MTGDADRLVCTACGREAPIEQVPSTCPACDGILDVVIASPGNQVELAAMAAAVVAQTPAPSTLELLTGRTVQVRLATEQLYQLDGDVEGTTTQLDFQILPGALHLRLPA